jgi:uncharacterized protein YkwD
MIQTISSLQRPCQGATLLGLLVLALSTPFVSPATAATVKHAAVSNRLDLAKAVIQQMNRVRTDPQGYAAFLESCRPYYKDRLLEIPGQVPIRTQEGVGALDEAIRVLRRTSPVAPLDESVALKSSAALLAGEQSATGGIGHFGRDGSTPFTRMARYGTWLDEAAENVEYGSRSAERIVADLVVDDGESGRGHRRNILNEDFHVAGAGFGSHPRYGTVCVIDFAAKFAAR